MAVPYKYRCPFLGKFTGHLVLYNSKNPRRSGYRAIPVVPSISVAEVDGLTFPAFFPPTYSRVFTTSLNIDPKVYFSPIEPEKR